MRLALLLTFALVGLVAAPAVPPLTGNPEFLFGPDQGFNDKESKFVSVIYNSKKKEYLAVWWEEGTGQFSQYLAAQIIDGRTGQRVGVNFRVDEPATVCLAVGRPADSSFKTAYDSIHNEYLVIWEQAFCPSTVQLLVRRFNADTFQPIGATFVVPYTDQPTAPDIIFNPDSKEYLIVWEDRSRGIPARDIATVAAIRLTAGSTEFIGTREQTFISDTYQILERGMHPVVAYNPNQSEYLVIWISQNRFLPEPVKIRGQRLHSVSGEHLGENDFVIFDSVSYPKLPLHYDFDQYQGPSVAYDTDQHRYLVVRQGFSSQCGFTVNGQFLYPDGAKLGTTDFEIASSPACASSSSAHNPEVIYRPLVKEYFIVFHATDLQPSSSRDIEIFGQRLNYLEEKIGEILRVSDESLPLKSGSFTPDVAYNGEHDQIFISWISYFLKPPSERPDAYLAGRLLGSQAYGSPLNAVLKTSSSSGDKLDGEAGCKRAEVGKELKAKVLVYQSSDQTMDPSDKLLKTLSVKFTAKSKKAVRTFSLKKRPKGGFLLAACSTDGAALFTTGVAVRKLKR